MDRIEDLEIKFQKFENNFELHDEDWNCLDQIIQELLIPKNNAIDDHPFEKNDFEAVPDITVTCLKYMNTLFSHERNTAIECNTCSIKCIYSAILMCGEHSTQSLWTNDSSISYSDKTIRCILQTLGYNNLTSFLVSEGSKKKLHGVHLFTQLSLKLSKDNWKYFPASIQCYLWLLYQIKMPFMKEFVSLALPLSLNILSDYEIGNKILGLECLHHIITNISTSELHWNIQIEALYAVLKPLFYYREADLILPLTKCTLEALNKSQFTSKELDPKIDLKWSFMDDILTIYLPMMEYEQDIKRRCAYAQSLCLILENSDFSIGKWTAKLLSILDDYSKTSVTETESCRALNAYIHICWPLIENHCRLINVIAGRVLFKSKNDEALRSAASALNLIHKLLPDLEILNPEQIKKRRTIKT